MTDWPRYPVLFEINAWTWIDQLRRDSGSPMTLTDVPQAELEHLAAYGFDGIWLMGVWQRSPLGRQVALEHPGLQGEYMQALADFEADDVVGSPYAVYDYTVDARLGGDAGLAELRRRLRDLGLRLVLDFVPNHVAVDHRWVTEFPTRLVQGDSAKLAREPGNYFQTTASGPWRVFAHGRDPYFDGWTDTAQIDYRSVEARHAMGQVLRSIAQRCDGVRCDMAMLVCRDIFLRTWGGQFEPPSAEFWPCIITEIKAEKPGWLLLAEVYWDMEWDLQQQGFDYTYDKRLYDRLLDGDAMAIRGHLNGALGFQQHLARFIENHDERRAMEVFGLARSQMAAVLSLTLPGLRLLHQGQLEGRRIRLPVQLGRRPPEEPVDGLEDFYRLLLAALQDDVFHDGTWQSLRPLPEWEGNPSHTKAVAHGWVLDGTYRLVIANVSDQPAQFFLPLNWPELAGSDWVLVDLISAEQFMRAGDEMLSRGLYVSLPGYGYHLFRMDRS